MHEQRVGRRLIPLRQPSRFFDEIILAIPSYLYRIVRLVELLALHGR